MSSSTESPHNSHLLFVGQQCHAEQCYLVDFLPFRCDHCTHAFCADHYKPATHACEKYDASKHDRIAPPCPLCNTPVAIPPDQDPNMRMEQHIEKECSVTTGRGAKQGSMPVCARGKCGKVLFAPIKCNSCDKQYCAAHRFPSSHACSPTASSSQFSVAAVSTKFFAKRMPAASAAAMAANKRNTAPAKPTPSVTKPVGTNFFAKQTPPGSAAARAVPNAVKADAGASSKSTNFFVKSKTDRCDSSSIPVHEIRTPISPILSTSTYATNNTDVVTSPSSAAASPTSTQPLPSPTAGDTCKCLDAQSTLPLVPSSILGVA